MAGRQAGREQVLVALLAGGRGLGGPDGVQDRQVIGAGQGTQPVLGGGQELAVPFQDRGQHGQRLAGRGGRGGRGGGGRPVRHGSGRSGPARAPAGGRGRGRRVWGTR